MDWDLLKRDVIIGVYVLVQNDCGWYPLKSPCKDNCSGKEKGARAEGSGKNDGSIFFHEGSS